MRLVSLMCMVMVCGFIGAADNSFVDQLRIAADKQTNMEKLDEAVNVWLHKNSNKREQESWTKNWEEQKDIPDEKFTVDMLHIFCIKNNIVTITEHKDVLSFTMMIRRTIDKKYKLSDKLKEHFNSENVKTIVAFLTK